MLYFVAIIRTKATRERYGLTGMEFFADGLMGFAITLAGTTRIIQIFLGRQNDTVSRIVCVIMPHNIILSWTEPMTAIAMLVVSIDRLISIIRPVFYYKKMLNIQHYLLAASNLSILLLILASVLCSYQNNVGVNFFCCAAAGSVILYIITLFIVRRYNKRIKEQQNTETIKINRRQLNFTKTVGLSCFATAGLYVLPMIVAFVETSNEVIPNSVYSTIVIISFLNSLSKTIIVGCRSHEIREALIDSMPGIFHKFGIHKAQTAKVIEFKTRQVHTTTFSHQ
ncbi:putative integral membrane protein [Acanthocheilonema viteae]